MNTGERLGAQVDRALSSLAGEFARVVYLASLRDAYSGRYVHEGLATVGSVEEVHQTLHARHRDAFREASALPLDSLCRQVQEHFATLGAGLPGMVKMWLELEPFRDVFPSGASELEREFFLSQMRLALKLLAGSIRIADQPVPAASPHR